MRDQDRGQTRWSNRTRAFSSGTRYQFWDHHYGCDEPETNEWTPNGSAYLDLNLQFGVGDRWDGQAALILVGYFGPNHPEGPGSPSVWDPHFSIRGTDVYQVPVELG